MLQKMHSFVLLLSAFLSLMNNPVFILGADDEQYTNCKEAISCGNFTNVSYPFWGENRNDYCGQPGLELKCQNNVLLMNMTSISFRILEFNSNARTLKVARDDYWGSICPPTFVNTTLNWSLFNYASDFTNTTFYYGCTGAITGATSTTTCNINNKNISASYLTANTYRTNPGSCQSEVIVPILTTALQSNPSSIQTALQEGFNLGLQIDYGPCLTCEGSGGQCGYNTSDGGFLCLCQDKPYPTTCNTTNNPSSSGSSGGQKKTITIGLAVGGALLLGIFVGFYFYCFLRRKKQNLDDQVVEAFLKSYGPLQVRRYTYLEVKKMTDSFKQKLGQGGYGSVYKGKLKDNGCVVAVKVLNKLKGNGEDFINEVATISRTSHVNVVILLGFCFEGSKRALIYEFMPNGSLEKFIYAANATDKEDNNHLGWEALDQISLGIARGLEYLHRGCNTRILHFDIKPHNILLDENFIPKISDFGLAKLCDRKDSVVSMLGGRGTFGYVAPEVFCRNFGGVSHKSDVYSYGMMLSEMVGGRRNIDAEVGNTSEIYFPHWIYKRLELDEELGLQSIMNEEDKVRARKMSIVSLWCIQTDPSNRPAMKQVIEMLEGSVDALQIPPKPYLSSPPRSPAAYSTTTTTTLVSIE